MIEAIFLAVAQALGLSAWYRMRGDKFNLRILGTKGAKSKEQAIFAFLVVALVGVYTPYTILFMIAIIAGISTGWGKPLGEYLEGKNDGEYEWYQIGFLKKPKLGLVARAFIMAIPAALVGAISDPKFAAAGIILGFSWLATEFIIKNWVKSEELFPILFVLLYSISGV